MKRSQRCINLNSIASSPEDAVKKLKQEKEYSSEEVRTDSQDHPQEKAKRMFDLNVTCSETSYGGQNSYGVNELGEQMTRIHCFSPRSSGGGNRLQEGIDESDVQIVEDTPVITLTALAALEMKKKHEDDGEIIDTPNVSVGKGNSSMTSAPEMTKARLVSNTMSSSNNDQLLSFSSVSDSRGLSKCKSTASNAMTVRVKQETSRDETSLSKLIDLSQSERIESMINHLLSAADPESERMNVSKPASELANEHPIQARNIARPSRPTCPCLLPMSAFLNAAGSGPTHLPPQNPVRFLSPLTPEQIRNCQSRARMFMKTRKLDVTDPIYALKWVPSSTSIGPRAAQGNFYPLPNQITLPMSPPTQTASNFPISIFSFAGNSIKDANYTWNLLRQRTGQRQRFPNFPFSIPQDLSSSTSHLYPIPCQHQKPLLREIRPKPITPKPKYLKPCKYYKQATGCRKGSNCPYVHDKPTNWPPKELEKSLMKKSKLFCRRMGRRSSCLLVQRSAITSSDAMQLTF